MVNIFSRRPRRDLIESAQKEIGGLQPPMISIFNGRFHLVDASKQRFAWPAFYMDVIVLDVNEHRSKVYWPDWNPNNDDAMPPICFSDNGLAPSVQASQPQSPTCESCPWDVWGSAINEKTGKSRKACSDRKKVAVLVIGDSAAMPYQLQIPPASLKAWSNYSGQVSAMRVPGQNTRADLDYVITRITFIPEKVGELAFECVGWISSVQQNANGGFSLASDDGQRILMAPDQGQAIAAYMDRIIDSKITDAVVGRLDKPRDPTVAIGQQRPVEQLAAPQGGNSPRQGEYLPLSQQGYSGNSPGISPHPPWEAQAADRPVFDSTAMAHAQQRGPAPSAPAGLSMPVQPSQPNHGGVRTGAGRPPKKPKPPAALASEPATGARPQPVPAQQPAQLRPQPPFALTQPMQAQPLPPAPDAAPPADDDGISTELRRSPPTNPAFAQPSAAPADIDQALAVAFGLKT